MDNDIERITRRKQERKFLFSDTDFSLTLIKSIDEVPKTVQQSFGGLEAVLFYQQNGSISVFRHKDNSLSYIFSCPPSKDNPKYHMHSLVDFDPKDSSVTGEAFLVFGEDIHNPRSSGLDNVPHTKFTETVNNTGEGLATRRLWTLHRMALLMHGKPLYSSTRLEPLMRDLWKKLVAEGLAESAPESFGKEVYRMKTDEELHFFKS